MEFKKYNSIENSFLQEFMERVRSEMPFNLEYVVEEKVHGANTSFITNGQDVRFAKRTSILERGENFYGYEKLLESYRDKIIRVFRRLNSVYPDLIQVSVFGEMFGGIYPHRDVPAIADISPIQKGVFYSPSYGFYGFDIYLLEGSGGRYLPVDEANVIFAEEGFLYAKTLFRGSLQACLEYPNAFSSHIPEYLGLPPIEGNICEGVVIKPVVPQFLRNGTRVILKNKNAKFAEKKAVGKLDRGKSGENSRSQALQDKIEEVELYITENRLANVVSHIGQVSFPKDFGRVMGLFAQDILNDYLKEHRDIYRCLSKSEQKEFNKEINRLATALVRKMDWSKTCD